jgi:hypothetical protein
MSDYPIVNVARAKGPLTRDLDEADAYIALCLGEWARLRGFDPPDGEYLLVPKDKVVDEFMPAGTCSFCDGSGMDPATYRPATWDHPSEAEPCPICLGGKLKAGRRYLIVEDTDE